MQRFLVVIAVLGAMAAIPVAAATGSFEVTIRNKGDTVLACDASIAHWYSDGVGQVAPGDTLRFTLYADVESGTVFLRNAVGDDMPVQRLWCGVKGKSWATRAEIALDRRAGKMPEPISLECSAGTTGTTCAVP